MIYEYVLLFSWSATVYGTKRNKINQLFNVSDGKSVQNYKLTKTILVRGTFEKGPFVVAKTMLKY